MMHICIGHLTNIGSDNGLWPGRRQAIIWTNAGMLLIGSLWTNFSEILIEIPTFSFKKMHLKVSSTKRRPFCLCLNVLTVYTVCWASGHLFTPLPTTSWPYHLLLTWEWQDQHWPRLTGSRVGNPKHQLITHWLNWTNTDLMPWASFTKKLNHTLISLQWQCSQSCE